jgi:hypothetical protein
MIELDQCFRVFGFVRNAVHPAQRTHHRSDHDDSTADQHAAVAVGSHG